jgi:hypothetical protein
LDIAASGVLAAAQYHTVRVAQDLDQDPDLPEIGESVADQRVEFSM